MSFIDPEGKWSWVIGGALMGAGLNISAQYLRDSSWKNFSWSSLIASTASGALGGGLGHITRNLRPFWNIKANSGGSGLIGGVITCVQNKFTGSKNDIVDSMLIGAFLGGSGATVGNITPNIFKYINNHLARKYFSNLSLPDKLGAISNAKEKDPNYKPFLIKLGIILGNAFSNFVGNLNQ